MIKNKSELKKEFLILQKNYVDDDKLREDIIGLTRNITKLSKQSIYSTQRNELKEAEKLILEVEDSIKKASKKINTAKIHLMNNLRSGLEEYVEAKTFYTYMKENKILCLKDFKSIIEIPYETYLEGLCDFTGEIAKKSVLLAVKGDTKQIKNIMSTIEDIYGLFLEFDFRSSELRKKFESIKYNLNKVESIIYDLSLRKRSDSNTESDDEN
jgi:translin